MKKILLLLSIFLFCGCNFNEKEYVDFEHYDLKQNAYETFTYVRENTSFWKETEIENYVVADISDGEMGDTEGLLYKVRENDYILLDSFNGIGTAYGIVGNSLHYNVLQYKDKIYIVRNELLINEYTLNRENTTVRELATKFDYSSITSNYEDGEHLFYPYGHNIKKVDNDYIYFNGISIHNTDKHNLFIKCSLKDYKCEEYK